MSTIILFFAVGLSLLLSVASVYNSNRLRLQFSRNRLKKEILEVKDDVEYQIKQLHRDWDDTYEKLRSIAGRIDRAKRKGKGLDDGGDQAQMPLPNDPHQQILNIARQRGMM